ncbi:MAG: GNAT family N-acetyltransferase [Acidobacteria bacterium]|jgi:GNAT superfamily N-acetyltransferase|nr:GNAT family N-acetyltransferase [Acidobacteriota bacterium]
MIRINRAATDAEIAACFSVMHQLRPHLQADAFVARVRVQEANGYHLASLMDDGVVRCVAGYRFIENLYSGRVLYVDDLVTDDTVRSKGYGKAMLDWVLDLAHSEHCDTLELDSGVQRFDAHRFYLVHRMAIVSHHFRLKL